MTHFTQFSDTSNLKFDYIISNPPYFSYGEASKHRNLGIARHNSALPIIEFWNCVNKISSDKSTKVGLIYPFEEAQICIINAMEMGWNVHRRLNIYPKETEINGMNPKRVALEFSRENLPFEVEDLFILAKNGLYTKAYIGLNKGFLFVIIFGVK
jgi:tRNA1(Val) A37 N6-methylase TrmN6